MKDDEQLHAAAMAGGPEAFAPIVERYQDAVFGVALARLRSFHDAQDVAQQVFIEAFARLESLRDPRRLGAWLRSITIHKSIDHLAGRRHSLDLSQTGEPASSDMSPPAAAERSELRDRVMAAIGELSKTQRETTTLFYINGYSVAEVAAMQEVPVGTVKRRLHDAREKLKEEMITMVEDVLRAEAPKEDFGQHVFEILNRYDRPPVPWDQWQEVADKLRAIGSQGIEGFAQALESPHSPTRMFATRMVPESGQSDEVAEQLLQKCLCDPSKGVRWTAVRAIFGLTFYDEDKCAKLLPHAFPLLRDRSKRLRRFVAGYLAHHPPYWKHVPLDCVARAVTVEGDPEVRATMIGLMRAVLKAQDDDQDNP